MSRIARGTILRADDGGGCLMLQVRLLDGEIVDHVETFIAYGFTALPLAGAECVVAFIEDSTDHAVAIAIEDRRYRIAGKSPGELTLYSAEGAQIALRDGRLVEVDCDAMTIRCADRFAVDAPVIDLQGETATITASDGVVVDAPTLAATGDVTDRDGSSSMQDLRDTYGVHTHAETGIETQPPTQQAGATI